MVCDYLMQNMVHVNISRPTIKSEPSDLLNFFVFCMLAALGIPFQPLPDYFEGAQV